MTDLARLRHLVATTDPAPDADLLARFITNRDGPAFAALVRRHGPMVLAVCRRVLRHRQDAEDAFQATFLVLARRAGALGPRLRLGNWLYGVAYRTALGARRAAAVRRERESRAAETRTEAGTPDDGFAPELREALDRELVALPGVYRAAVVACDLEGLPRREAAVRLGWTEGTLSSRLARARSLLARRLSRYGLAVPAAGLGAVSVAPTVACELADSTVRLSVLVATGGAVIAPPVAVLVEGTMKAMFLTKLRATASACVVACAIVAVSVAGGQSNTAVADTPKNEGAKRAAPNSDKERIAELERERDRLRKEVTELRERLAQATWLHALQSGHGLSLRVPYGFDGAPSPWENAQRFGLWGQTLAPPAKDGAPSPWLNMLPPVGQGQTLAPPAKDGTLAPPAKDAPAPIPGDGRTPPEAAKVLVRVYPVGKLVDTVADGETLAKVVRATVEPKSWGADAGSVEFLASRLVLVVRQTEKGHAGVAELLKQLQPSAPGGR
ncbi:sigma-70 family rna polymerase sigma factor : RNA polymerase sigma factor, sigma-70 family OS=Singulisphaera acidiphila (strain ATCC BAA-1392 / DSM 18658 / VKM B-2454 / MOB10) GN=Sinac_7487 PE=4 SV=1: Sigma70_r2: Sigma70_r4_2 [Gemmata massiliana]|uniref:Uncharacterized protein n=1 Tax=Gemmata massiliana TaxID=1210884 RepID=A0A6P2CVZ1_9BACT|nr:sigma-70 family RNA polymerase sigma factor [Gemmata massiliana]VTR93308.1 sigma-70 family rna polymerase sigma factor : RNA polymerase sigma factor, sigma-70 family OS=Singulisphaera acidiphila (strain ATCC BAA-1392 / DSM 18658 / VKM B-2454 / MOB10) GN=Sinac_7487 PE=4 SV=1: Sigma70_r2: Sigma70_r4_2 [Gemmata massiliana]